MENLSIQTSQNVDIQHNIASVGERILSQLLDFLFLFVYFLAMLFVNSKLSYNIEWVWWVMFVPMFFYSLLFEIIMNGQTLGKRILKIRVVKLDGSQPGILNYFIRWLFRLIDIWLFWGSVAIVTIAVNGKGQRLGDIAAGTSVIRLGRKIRLKETLLVHLPQNYQVIYPQVSLLLEEEISLVQEVLSYHTKNRSKKSQELLDLTKSKIEKKMGVKSHYDSFDFLRIVVFDFNKILNSLCL